MKRLFLILTLTAFSLTGYGQIRKTTTWAFDVSKEEVKVGEEVELIFRVNVIDNWYIYSSDLSKEIAPSPTEVNFEVNESFEVIGDLIPVNPKKKYDEVWKADVTYMTGTGEFRQKIRVLNKDIKISGTLDFQTCSDLDGQCVFGDKDFSITSLTVLGTRF